jgi:AraC-like DNA-binding protein
MYALQPAPHGARQFASDDPDLVTQWAEEHDGYHSRVIHGTGPYGFRAWLLQGRRVSVAVGRTGLRQTIRAMARQPIVQIPLNRPQEYSCGRQRLDVSPGTLAFFAPGVEVSRHSDPAALLGVDLDAAALVAAVQQRSAEPIDSWPQVLLTFDMSEPPLQDFSGALADLVTSSDPAAPLMLRKQCEHRVIEVLADALASRLIAQPVGRLAARRAALLEAWIEANLGEHITLARLCAVAQASERSLQQAFQARRGMSPMRFVCERRLAAARRRIVAGGADDGITGIATSLGFTHLGRFAIAYREAFGEPPSRTWTRARRLGIRNGETRAK